MFFDAGKDFFAEREIGEGLAKVVQRSAAERQWADGLIRGGGIIRAEGDGLELVVEHPGLIDFGEVVIFGGEPEDGHGGSAGSGELAGSLNGGERLVQGVNRTGEQTNLLAGEDGDGARLGQAIERGMFSV